jgi:5-methyltetrahydrofolate corrinoid/iron sulfur protein methyltransferase
MEPTSSRRLRIGGDLINNAYGRARRAWMDRDLGAYQKLARLQVEAGAEFLDVNLDGTQNLQVKREEMLAFLPEVIPAIQEVARVPLCLDNPRVDFHRVALEHYDSSIGGPPIINSLAASRERLEEMIELVGHYKAWAIVMASERFVEGGSAQCFTPQDCHEAVREFVERLHEKVGCENERIMIDPGLPPVGADTYGLVNLGLDAMRLIRQDPDLQGVHLSVGLTNFSWGIPQEVRGPLEHAYLTLATQAGLDMVLANPEKNPHPLPPDHPLVGQLREALEDGRPQAGESQQEAGYRQAERIMAICSSGG